MITALLLLTASGARTTDLLAAGFRTPPASVRPHTWWHWMNGNVTKEGITADLKAMKQVGIGGAQMFTVDQDIPAGPAKYAGPKWRALTAFAVKEASRLGLEPLHSQRRRMVQQRRSVGDAGGRHAGDRLVDGQSSGTSCLLGDAPSDRGSAGRFSRAPIARHRRLRL